MKARFPQDVCTRGSKGGRGRSEDEDSKPRPGAPRGRPCISGAGIFVVTLLVIMACVRSSSAEEFGSLRLCPAGGRSFMMAWNLACEMKRKKRSVPDVSDVILGTSSPRPSAYAHADGFNPGQEAKKKRAAPEGYRPATLTEIMRICCDVGCEVRDLLAYCDPFGPWNS